MMIHVERDSQIKFKTSILRSGQYVFVIQSK